ncbi:imidazole glycerol phosphate synthase, glutamine amidotransferase subunit [candidate division WOR-1 bacterium RIFCSPHIGHO2_01_FULL_53_15]|uniref:Imidazole glycerol phosphate synthase subunit HisH n=1 Tax=candidate division WOR-1 bacterium RIFCSPHIGHO2_01_FULL_53_15 TaxID=1802564 RepID=A0A1F4Q4J1_UNCSA|nr:MAG: imidazole glycerol phosphate synthase, glutamine amidotransferase subunit [candidate division WOR-1 bacterium RIFCSPHIGHO2_01_FULL_53_15]OGC10571.1 MAG: imidazole glycerol phosphate synthase, glutamine amidotransferase subunit [candidate division WOR-1 bacterium RIFCSPHIGHO2_02_FULL_53_26]
MSLAIIDYGAGNLRSVEKAFQKVGVDAEITKDKNTIRGAKGIVFPGVGSFDAAISELRTQALEGVVEEAIALGKPFLGICLGMQHLFETSEEGKARGLAILPGAVKKFNFSGTPWSNLSVPHMGWNRVLFKHKAPIFEGIEEGTMFYFAHSFYVDPKDEMIVATRTDYGIEFVSAVWKDNIYGLQFHPEKSGEAGLKLLRNFGHLTR